MIDDTIAAWSAALTEVYKDIETGIDIQRAIDALTIRQRVVVRLWMDGYTQREIGAMLGISQPAVCQCLMRAIKAITSYHTDVIFSRPRSIIG